jgi:hypothetical protein
MRSFRLAGLIAACLLAAGCGVGKSSLSPPPSAATLSPPPAPTLSDAPPASSLSPPPSAATPSPGPETIATGCLNLDQGDCTRVRDLVLAGLPAGSPPAAYVEVGPFACRVDPCPEVIADRPTGRVTIEFADGSGPTILEVSVEGGVLTTRPAQDVFLVSVPPTSRRLPAPQATIEVGHCGLLSGIDVDGSFWNPIGRVDMQHQDAVNSVRAEFTLTTPATATLRTANGLELELVRHPGAKHLPACM